MPTAAAVIGKRISVAAWKPLRRPSYVAPTDIRQLDIVEHDAGIELRMWLTELHAAALSERRRYLAGPTGCGLCGIQSLDEAVRPSTTIAKFCSTDVAVA